MPTNVAVQILPEQLPALRRKAGLTQGQLAGRLGVHHTQVCAMERSLLPGGLLQRATTEILTAITASCEEGQK